MGSISDYRSPIFPSFHTSPCAVALEPINSSAMEDPVQGGLTSGRRSKVLSADFYGID